MKEGLYTICVYTNNYNDTEIIWNVRKELEKLGFPTTLSPDALQDRVIYYKPDIFTHLKAYDEEKEFGTTYIYTD
jgi:hypothetical protein